MELFLCTHNGLQFLPALITPIFSEPNIRLGQCCCLGQLGHRITMCMWIIIPKEQQTKKCSGYPLIMQCTCGKAIDYWINPRCTTLNNTEKILLHLEKSHTNSQVLLLLTLFANKLCYFYRQHEGKCFLAISIVSIFGLLLNIY